MAEHEADQVMDWIADVSSWNPEDVVIKHMYEMHKLRDRNIYVDLELSLYYLHYTPGTYRAFQQMQTF